MKAGPLVASILFASGAMLACTREAAASGVGKVSTMDEKLPCDFSSITPGSGDDNPCSPPMEDDFRGIRINGPNEILFGPDTVDPFMGGFARIIVAGICQLEHQTLGLRGLWSEFVLLVAVDSRTKRVYVGTRKPWGTPARPLDPLEGEEETPDDYRGSIAGTWFNPNLARDLDLPAQEADYDVYATLGPYRSNVVHIRVRRKK